jgi:hypothetical protein
MWSEVLPPKTAHPGDRPSIPSLGLFTLVGVNAE